MYAICGNMSHQYIPNVSIYTSTMDPMGYENIWPHSGAWPQVCIWIGTDSTAVPVRRCDVNKKPGLVNIEKATLC